MKKTTTYVAPCVAPKKNEALTAILIFGGLVFTIGGVGTAEKVSLFYGILVAIVGLMIMYKGVVRIPRPYR